MESLGENRLIGVVSQIDPRTDVPGPTELHETGTVAIVHKIVRMREGQLLFCEGVSRMRIKSYTSVEPFLRARIERMPEIEPEATPELTALRQNVLSEFTQIVSATPNLSDDVATAASNITEIGRLADFIAARSEPEPHRAPVGAGAERCQNAPAVHQPATGPRSRIARVAPEDPVAGAGAALAEPARVFT